MPGPYLGSPAVKETTMSKKEKEFKRRVGKIDKHLTALNEILSEVFAGQKKQAEVQEVLNSMEDSTRFLKDVLALLKEPAGSRPADQRGIAN